MNANGTGSPDLSTGRWRMRRSPGLTDALMAGCDAILLGSIILYWQSAWLRAVGEVFVAQLRETERAFAREGASG